MDIPPEIQSIVERFETSGLNFDKTFDANKNNLLCRLTIIEF